MRLKSAYNFMKILKKKKMNKLPLFVVYDEIIYIYTHTRRIFKNVLIYSFVIWYKYEFNVILTNV